MLTIQYLRDNKAEAIEKLNKRFFKGIELIDQAIELDNQRKDIQKQLDDTLAESNQLAKQIGQLMKEGKKEEAEASKALTATLKVKSNEFGDQLKETEKSLHDILVQIPNTPNSIVKAGKTPEENEVVYTNNIKSHLGDDALPHWDLADKYNLIDFELGVKLTGAGFPVYKGKAAKLQRALINYFLDSAEGQGYVEHEVPILINADSGYGTGQLPDKEGQMYHSPTDDFYLIPTAEVPLTNIYRDVILKEEELPIKLTAYTPCFRREAGSYGKDVRGLNRLHQFDKVEIVQIAHPDQSYNILETMKDYVGTLLESLGLEYRILRLCGGDMGFTSAMTYDFEVYSAAQKRWLEVSSTSCFESFQANRLKCRFKDSTGKTRLVHTLNGSALALPRIVASIMENFQTPDGIIVPQVLRNYTKFDIIN
jgi:seryl-tRNA synthetase